MDYLVHRTGPHRRRLVTRRPDRRRDRGGSAPPGR